MRRHARFTVLVSLAVLAACARSVVVSAPPRVDLTRYPTIGIVEFTASPEGSAGLRASRQFQEQIQAAQPGTRFIELGAGEVLLASLGARQFDAQAVRRIGEKYRVEALFVGELAFSEPHTSVKVRDLARIEGGVRAEIRGDLSSRLLETRTGASVWSNSSWATRQVGRLNVSMERGVSGAMNSVRPQEEMVPALVYHLTQDFRPTSVRQPAK